MAATTGVGTANADCVSVWGVGNSANCVSTPGNVAWVMFNTGSSFANATQGFGNIAVASGPNAIAVSGLGPLDFLNFAYAETPERSTGSTFAVAGVNNAPLTYPQYGDIGVGIGNIAIAAENDGTSFATALGLHNTVLAAFNSAPLAAASSTGTLNHIGVLFSQNQTSVTHAVLGVGSASFDLFGTSSSTPARGQVRDYFNLALNVASASDSRAGFTSVPIGDPPIEELAFLTFAGSFFGDNNATLPNGPLAFGATIGIDNYYLDNFGPGININGMGTPVCAPCASTLRAAAPPPALRTAAPGGDPAADGDGPVATAVNTVSTAVNTVSTAVSAAADGDGPLASAVRQVRAGDGPLASAVRQVRAGDGPISTAVRQVRAGDGPLASAVRQVRAGDGPLASAVRQVRDTLGANE